MRYSKGIMWLDDTRIPFVDDTEDTTRGKYENKVQVGIMAERPNIKFVGSFDDSAKQGRFTPNLLVCDDMLNDGSITGGKDFNIQNKKEQNIYGFPPIKEKRYITQDKGTNSRYYSLDLWFNKMVDEL